MGVHDETDDRVEEAERADGGDVADRPPLHHAWRARVDGAVGPWIDWFGAGRLLAGVLTAVTVVAGGWWLLRPAEPSTEAGLPRAAAASTPVAGSASAAPATTSTGPPVPTVVVVHVAGAVAAPGVYELPAGARVHAALDAAGGALADAATGTLNLAAPLADGERVYVPVAGETPPPAPTAPGGEGGTATDGTAGPVDVNRATAEQLDALPGVGPATAEAIVDHRTTNGPFATVDDLEAVRGIGPAKLEALRPLVTT